MNTVPWATEDWDNAAFQPTTASMIPEITEEWGLLGLQGQTREKNRTEMNLPQQRVNSRDSVSQSWSMLRAGTDNHMVVGQNQMAPVLFPHGTLREHSCFFFVGVEALM